MRKIPLRKCLATNEQLPKKELIRVVRNKEGQVFVEIPDEIFEELKKYCDE